MRRSSHRILIAAIAAGVAAVVGLTAPAMPAGRSPLPNAGNIDSLSERSAHSAVVTWRKVTGGLKQPVAVLAAPDGTDRLFIVEKGGTVRVWKSGKLLRKRYLSISRIVRDDGEGGLLSIAFDPNFRNKPRLWAAYTRSDGDLVIARFRASGPRVRSIDPSTRRTVLRIEHSRYQNHYGGQIAFGPKNLLFIGTGDGGGGGDPLDVAQKPTSLLGKILRIDVRSSCGGKRYCVPPGNPYVGDPGRNEVWLLGLRNPWRFSFDPRTDRLWIGDVGQDSFEEVNRVAPDPKARNLGWSCLEGREVFNASRCLPGETYLKPTAVVSHPRGESITGGVVYRGSRYRDLLGGVYVFGDFVTRRVWLYATGDGLVEQRQLLGPAAYNGPTAFGVDNAREVMAVTYDGTLWRMRAKQR